MWIVRRREVRVHRVHHLLILMRASDREHFRVGFLDDIGLSAEATGDDDFAIGLNRLADGVEAFIAGAVEKAARVHQDKVGAGIVRTDLVSFGAQPGDDAL